MRGDSFCGVTTWLGCAESICRKVRRMIIPPLLSVFLVLVSQHAVALDGGYQCALPHSQNSDGPCVIVHDALLSVEARQQSWEKLLRQIHKTTGMLIHPTSSQGSVTVSFRGLSVGDALRQLFGRDISFVLVYRSRGSYPTSSAFPAEAWIVGSTSTAQTKTRGATGKAQPVSTTLPASASISQPVAGDAQEKDSLMEMTQSDNPTMRVQGLSELSEGSKADAATVRSVLTHAVNDPDASVRGYAIQALAHRGGGDVMGYLWLALQDPDPSVRMLAIQSIGSQEQAIPLLQQALSDKDEAVRFIAASLLKQHKSN